MYYTNPVVHKTGGGIVLIPLMTTGSLFSVSANRAGEAHILSGMTSSAVRYCRYPFPVAKAIPAAVARQPERDVGKIAATQVASLKTGIEMHHSGLWWSNMQLQCTVSSGEIHRHLFSQESHVG
jgi:hypothetical protein